MERVNSIINHPVYQYELSRIEGFERDRLFCGHGMVHFTDVSRIGWIINLEYELGYPKDIIYGIGMLHDIGRGYEYEENEAHEIASARVCQLILKDSGYSDQEIGQITEAILNHRNKSYDWQYRKDNPIAVMSLSQLMYKADKLSRGCYGCQSNDLCDWNRKKKNGELLV